MRASVLVALLTFVSARAAAEVQLPARSPRGQLIQQVGLTTVTVEYSSPAVGGRSIWGTVVPYGQVWRTGDLPAPRITFSRDVALGDKSVPAGTYALVTIPAPGEWTIILNKNATLIGERDYRPELDVARVKVPATPAPFRERFLFLFSEFTDEQAALDLEWAALRVSIPIKVNTAAQLTTALGTLDGVWRQYADVARYLQAKGDTDAALTYIDRSLALRQDGDSAALKASLLAAKGRHPGARAKRKEILPASVLPAPPRVATREFSSSLFERGEAQLAPTITPGAVRDERPVRAIEGRHALPVRTPGSAEIAPLIKTGRASIEACYQRSLRQDPSLARGRLTISVSVGTSGLVTSVALEPPGPFRALEPCLKDAISRWVFPPSPVAYETEIPIVLRGSN